MNIAKLYYATNRAHKGKDRWNPDGYGVRFSKDGHENLRFGELEVEYDGEKVNKCLDFEFDSGRTGDGEKLTEYLKKPSKRAKITAYQDDTAKAHSLIAIENNSSTRLFRNIKERMMTGSDVLVYIHGYNVSWESAVASALSLQFMLNSKQEAEQKEVIVVLFSWPSNGSMMPWAAYKSDRVDARNSGASIGRGLLKLRDFLGMLKRESSSIENAMCGSDVHLLCHSMGNYVLRNAIQKKLIGYCRGRMPRIFKHVFLCAADEDDDTLEGENGLSRLHELASFVTVYYNREDLALYISDTTKGHPDRLGQSGSARPALVHNKVHQVDCAPLIRGLTEHSYYLWATVNQDIRQSINAIEFTDPQRNRKLNGQNREWTLT